jgi:hypothetical protein
MLLTGYPFPRKVPLRSNYGIQWILSTPLIFRLLRTTYPIEFSDKLSEIAENDQKYLEKILTKQLVGIGPFFISI